MARVHLGPGRCAGAAGRVLGADDPARRVGGDTHSSHRCCRCIRDEPACGSISIVDQSCRAAVRGVRGRARCRRVDGHAQRLPTDARYVGDRVGRVSNRGGDSTIRGCCSCRAAAVIMLPPPPAATHSSRPGCRRRRSRGPPSIGAPSRRRPATAGFARRERVAGVVDCSHAQAGSTHETPVRRSRQSIATADARSSSSGPGPTCKRRPVVGRHAQVGRAGHGGLQLVGGQRGRAGP